MEKLLFLKQHVKESTPRTYRDRGSQTLLQVKSEKFGTEDSSTLIDGKICGKPKSKEDLEDSSAEAVLVRSLFFTSPNTYDDIDLGNCGPSKYQLNSLSDPRW